MKEYIITYSNYSIFSNTNTYYVINNELHGLYILFSSLKNIHIYKGYINMNIEISHWKEYNVFFKYYL